MGVKIQEASLFDKKGSPPRPLPSRSCYTDNLVHVTYQFVVAGLELYVVGVAHEQLTHELEILDGELVTVVHELDVLFTDAPLDRSRHLHLTRTILCGQDIN